VRYPVNLALEPEEGGSHKGTKWVSICNVPEKTCIKHVRSEEREKEG